MPKTMARADSVKFSIRAHVEHVFAHQKNRMGMFIRTIGLARAEAKLPLYNLAYNFDRLFFHERRESMGCSAWNHEGSNCPKRRRKQINGPLIMVEQHRGLPSPERRASDYPVFAGVQCHRFNQSVGA